MRRLQYKVNLVPVIAKADCLTAAEVKRLKERINSEIEAEDIEIYQFPDCDSDEDDDFKSQDSALKASVPFAIVGGTHSLEVAGKKVRGRQYPWGFVEVDNPRHSDFALLRRFLIQTHMQDLKDVTHDVHYENYRVKCLSDLAKMKGGAVPNSAGQMAALAASAARGKSQEDLVDQQETEKLLQEKDVEIQKMQRMLRQMQAKLDATK